MAVSIPVADNIGRVAAVGGGGAQGFDPNIVTRSQQQAGDIVDRAQQGLAAANERFAGAVGDQANQYALKQKAIIDDSRVKDAATQLGASDADLSIGEKGYKSIRGENFVTATTPVIPDFMERRKQAVAGIAETLTDPEQKKAFNDYASQTGLQFQRGIMEHAMQQHDVYDAQVYDGVRRTATEVAAASSDDPIAVLIQRQNLIQNIADWRAKGRISTEQALIDTKNQLSDMHSAVINQMLVNGKTDDARNWLTDWGKKGEIDTGDMVKMNGLVTHQEATVVAKQVGGDVVTKLVGAANPPDSSRAFNVALVSESNNQQFNKDGTPVTSAKGAIGIAQVMPGTGPEAAKLAGLPWNEKRLSTDPEYNRALGQAYFNKQLQDNGGDVQKAWAAYNAGPGALQSAIKAADKNAKLAVNDPSIAGKTYLNFLPQETQDYVAKNSKAYQQGSGTAKTPTEAEVLAAVDNDPRLVGKSPEAQYAAHAYAKQLFAEHTQLVNQQNEATLKDFRGQVMDSKIKSRADIPSAMWDALGDKRDAALSFVDSFNNKIAKQDPLAVQKFNSMSLDTNTLINTPDADIMKLSGGIGTDKVDALITQKHTLLQDANKLKDAKDFEAEFKKQAVAYGLGGKSTDDDHVTLVSNIKDSIASLESEKKRKLTRDEQTAEIVKGVQKIKIENGHWFWPNSSRPGGLVEAKDIPAAARDRATKMMEENYQKTGLPKFAPTEENIVFWAKNGAEAVPRAR